MSETQSAVVAEDTTTLPVETAQDAGAAPVTETATQSETADTVTEPEIQAEPTVPLKRLLRTKEKVRALERKLQEANERLAQSETSDGQPAAQVDQRAIEEAYRMAAINLASENTYKNGKAEFGDDFDRARDNLVSAYSDELAARPEFFEAITALPNGHKVYYELGKNPALAEAILNMPPVRMGLELAKIANKAPAKPTISKAPPPAQPLKAQGSPVVDWSKMSQKEFAERRARGESPP